MKTAELDLVERDRFFFGNRVTAIEAFRGNKRVGELLLDDDGYIENVYVNEDYRRQGVATALYRYAVGSPHIPNPIHSMVLSQDGKLWADAVGGINWRNRNDL